MTKILFCHGASDRLQAVASWLLQLGDRCRQSPENLSTLVYVPDRNSTERLDQLLWTHSALSFLPHCQSNSPLAGETPVLLTGNLQKIPQEERLLNLSNELPEGFGRFTQVIEIISQDDAVRLPARDRAKFYRDRGYDVEYRDLQKDPL